MVNEGQMEGTLISFEGKTLEVEDGKEDYIFDVSNATIHTRNMRAGDELVIYYEGKLEGKDMSKIKVTKVEDLGDNEHQKGEAGGRHACESDGKHNYNSAERWRGTDV